MKSDIEIMIGDILLNDIVKQVVNDEKVTKSDSKSKFTQTQDEKPALVNDIVAGILSKVVEC